MKRLRQYRISLQDQDQLNVSISCDGQMLSYEDDFKVVNLSGSGIGVIFYSYHKIDGTIEVDLRVNECSLSVKGSVSRQRYSRDVDGQVYFGIEFVDVDDYKMQNIIFELIQTMKPKRLKLLLMDMIHNEGHALLDEVDELQASTSILVDLFQLFQKYNSSYKMMNLFAEEVKRTIAAEHFNFYTIENEGRDVSIFDFKQGKSHNSVLPLVGKVKDVKQNGRLICSRLSSLEEKDDFYNLLQTLYDVKVDTFVLAPVIDKSGHTIGVVEFSNKENHELFNHSDTTEVAILATILGLTFSTSVETDSFDYVRKIIDKANNGYLIGTSEQNRYLNSFIENVCDTDDCILITGEYGVGKKLVAINIHDKSARAQFGIGHINCHDIEHLSDLDFMLVGDSGHNGAFELYSGGTLVFKDINFLNVTLQKKLYELIITRGDIRFIATSSENLEVLKLGEQVYWPLINFFNSKNIRIPALRERKDDILPLAHYFTYTMCVKNGISPKSLSNELLNRFHGYDWPGNINELKIAIERLIILGHGHKSLHYKKTSILPILDREIDEDFTYGLDLSQDLFGQTSIENKDDFENLYFYYYVEELLSLNELESFEVPAYFDMEPDEFYAKLFHSHELAMTYFDTRSSIVEDYLGASRAA